jgi:hypothetical protein
LSLTTVTHLYDPTLQVSLAEHGWQFDVLLCHTGADNPFVGTLDGEMAKCGLEAFFDKESLDLGDEVQATVAEAIINSPLILPGCSQWKLY